MAWQQTQYWPPQPPPIPPPTQNIYLPQPVYPTYAAPVPVPVQVPVPVYDDRGRRPLTADDLRLIELQKEIDRLKAEQKSQAHALHEEKKPPQERQAPAEKKVDEADIIARWQAKEHKKRRDEEELHEHIKLQLELDKIRAKEREKEEYDAFLAKQAALKADEDARKKKEKEKLDAAFTERMLKAGYTEDQIKRIDDMAKGVKKEEEVVVTTTVVAAPSNQVIVAPPAPVSPLPAGMGHFRVRRKDISTEILREHKIGFRRDEYDEELLVIVEPIDVGMLKFLREETTRHRERRGRRHGRPGPLLLEKKRSREKLFITAQPRHRSRTRSRSRAREERIFVPV